MTNRKTGEGPAITPVLDNSISAEGTKNNTKYSLTDNQGRQLTKEQQEYFKDSKVRDENGNPTDNPDINLSLSNSKEAPLENRVSGDELLNAQDTLEIIKDVGGSVDNNGYVTLYHRTIKEKAKQIIDTKRMSAKEDGIFFSTSESGYNYGYGDSVLEFKVPVEKIVLDDIFGDEAHFRIPLKNRTKTLDVSEYIISENDGEYSLSNSNQDIAPTKDYRIYGKDIKLKDNIAPVNINKSAIYSKGYITTSNT